MSTKWSLNELMYVLIYQKHNLNVKYVQNNKIEWGLGVSIEMEKLTNNEGFVHFELVFLVNVCSTVNRLHFCTDLLS